MYSLTFGFSNAADEKKSEKSNKKKSHYSREGGVIGMPMLLTFIVDLLRSFGELSAFVWSLGGREIE